MIDDDKGPPGLDIGIHQTAQVGPASTPKQTRSERSFPTWAMLVAAVFVGWLLGSLLGVPNQDPTEADAAVSPRAVVRDGFPGESDRAAAWPTVSPTTPPAMITNPSQTTPSQTNPLQTISLSGASLVLAQLSGADRLPSAVTSIDNFGSRTALVDQRIAGPTQAVGDVAHRVQLVGESVVFIAGRQAVVVDMDAATEPAVITDAVTLLGGPGSNDVWAVADESRTLRLIDVPSRTVRATYDLTWVGIPVGSFNGGLVVAPDAERFGPFALWSPNRGIQQLGAFDDQASFTDPTFIDAADNVVVTHTSLGVASFNTVTGALTQTDRKLTEAERNAAFVSQSGTSLAIVSTSATGSAPTVEVIELATGTTIDEFEVAAPWLVHWTADGGLLYVAPGVDNQVTLRDSAFGSDTALVTLGADITWMVLVE